MRWAHAAVVAVAPCLIASLSACGSTVESESAGGGNSTSSTGTMLGTGGEGGTVISDGGSANVGGTSEVGGSSVGGAGGTGGDGSSTVYPAKHPAAPQVVDQGGPTVTTPKIVPVFFSNDDAATIGELADFLSKLPTSNYVSLAAGEYGVGDPTILPAINLTETATGTITDDQIQSWLQTKLQAGDGVFPAPDANTIYVLFYPSGVTVNDFGGLSCQSFGGYHFNTKLDDGTAAIYAVIPRCPADQGESALDLLTSATSHEIVEASTDPEPYDDTAYGALDNDHLSWEFLIGAEIGDLCAFTPSGFTNTIPGMPYLVQRAWSDKQAAAGHDPCAPAVANQVYFNAAPVENDTITLSDPGSGSFPMKGTKIAVGESKTIEIDLFSDGPTTDWQVMPYDGQQLFGGSAALDLTLDKQTGNNGDKLKLTIKVLSRGQYGVESYILYSYDQTGQIANIWAGTVGD
jgi:hypothetical protein